jgi:hypothetical protein
MEEMTPLLRMRVGQAKELPWYFWNGLLLHLRQHTEEFVGYCGAGTRVIRLVAADRARLPSKGMVVPGGQKGVLQRRQQRLACLRSEAGHRAYTPGTWGDLLVTWHRHRRHAVIGHEA